MIFFPNMMLKNKGGMNTIFNIIRYYISFINFETCFIGHKHSQNYKYRLITCINSYSLMQVVSSFFLNNTFI